MKTLSGRDLVDFIKERQAHEVRRLRQAEKVSPKLVIISTSRDPVTLSYTKLKQAYGADIGAGVEVCSVSVAEAVAKISVLNKDDSVHGIIVQLPLSDPAKTDELLHAVVNIKDVDGLGVESTYDAPTPVAINWLLAGYNINLEGKNIVIVGKGRLVGAPLEKMWKSSGLDIVTVDESTKDSEARIKLADIIVSAVGKPGLIHSAMVKEGAVVIDAGVSTDEGKLVGDVADDVHARDDISITPVKGGVGPLTVAALFENVLHAARGAAN